MANDRGFTLLEVLVAFIIAALALAVLFEGGLAGVRATRTAGRYEEAVARARSHLAALSADGALVPEELQGDDGGGYHWHLRVTPPIATTAVARSGDSSAAVPSQTAVSLYAVSVAISWKADKGERSVELETRRLGPPVRQGP